MPVRGWNEAGRHQVAVEISTDRHLEMVCTGQSVDERHHLRHYTGLLSVFIPTEVAACVRRLDRYRPTYIRHKTNGHRSLNQPD